MGDEIDKELEEELNKLQEEFDSKKDDHEVMDNKTNPEGGPFYGDLYIEEEGTLYEDDRGLPKDEENSNSQYDSFTVEGGIYYKPEEVKEKDSKLDIYDYLFVLGDKVLYQDIIKEFGNEAKILIKELLSEKKVTQYKKGNKFYFKAI
jgi:hypothetical protein